MNFIASVLLLTLCLGVLSAQLALRQSQWYFATNVCAPQFHDAMVKYDDCAGKLRGDQTCEEFAASASLCYKPFETFSCPHETTISREVRLMGRREKTIQHTILCKLNPELRATCLTKLDPEICRPKPDNTLDDICSLIGETQGCLFDEVERICPRNEVNETITYLEVVAKEVICAGVIDSGASTPHFIVTVLITSLIFTILGS